MVGEACLPSNAYYPRTPDYTLCFGVHVCWSEHSDSSFVYGFMILNYGFGTMTATTLELELLSVHDLRRADALRFQSNVIVHILETTLWDTPRTRAASLCDNPASNIPMPLFISSSLSRRLTCRSAIPYVKFDQNLTITQAKSCFRYTCT